ncbi:DUF3558 family protein [Corynebacterium tapiri]|uniref:DUF3558 domain-containing protein n=1 Tax=Corynebacterium tapiri TaxID=1448266 RepID=A0A5C4U6Q5_9CORY|nr:DUF3558 family protein [Corynebacterium tapiri]TNL99447.1 DUF3558 domain-containing protein [Corynebacterium tapiri]
MRRLLAALLTLLCVTGCSTAPGQTNTAEQPEGIYLSGEFVPFGDYDPHDHTIDWINPCEEIPEEVLREAGLEPPLEYDGTTAEISTCSQFNDDGSMTSVSGGRQDLSRFSSLENESKVDADGFPVRIGSYSPDDPVTCSALISTTRGALEVVILDFSTPKKNLERCENSNAILQKLLTLLGDLR